MTPRPPLAENNPEQAAVWAATLAVRKILAQAKNPATTLGRMRPTSVAYHAAWAAIETHRNALAAEQETRA